ncbi:MAG: hypothetical protein QNJ29_07750 [Rhizobiaceae bacterium]|nr:hypothetical protein [Rhizobiaceae bacterium]
MPLSILVPMILVGLPLVIGLVWWVNRGRSRAPLTACQAKDHFLNDFPNAVVDEILISDDGKNALLRLVDDNAIGMVHQMGQNHLTRLLDKSSVIGFETRSAGFEFRLNDFTLKSVSFENESLNARPWLSGFVNMEKN